MDTSYDELALARYSNHDYFLSTFCCRLGKLTNKRHLETFLLSLTEHRQLNVTRQSECYKLRQKHLTQSIGMTETTCSSSVQKCSSELLFYPSTFLSLLMRPETTLHWHLHP